MSADSQQNHELPKEHPGLWDFGNLGNGFMFTVEKSTDFIASLVGSTLQRSPLCLSEICMKVIKDELINHSCQSWP